MMQFSASSRGGKAGRCWLSQFRPRLPPSWWSSRADLRKSGRTSVGALVKDELLQALCVCEGAGLMTSLRKDLDRYVFIVQQQHGAAGPLLPLRVGIMSQGLWATTAYRLNHYARHRVRSRPLVLIPDLFHRVIVALTGIYIDPRAHIGSGLKFPHAGRIIIGPVRAGSNCDIFQGVTLGESSSVLSERATTPEVPTLGNRVWIGPGAVIAGGVTVNNDAVVAANSLLVRDVPPRGVMIGVPARLVSTHGSLTQIMYRAMDEDAERQAVIGESA